MQAKPPPLQALPDVIERRLEHDALVLEASTRPDGPILQKFYAGYDAAFVLPNEKEDLPGFTACLELNSGDAYTRLSAAYGAYRELVLVARDPTSGAVVGGANLIAFPLPLATPVLSINLNYVFIGAAHRRRGYFKRLVGAIGPVAAEFFEPAAAALPRFIFIEQNDPLLMSRSDYALDTEHSGIDQLTRIRLWSGLGARLIDFPYVQPPLSPQQAPDTTLLYGVLGAAGETLDACLLHAHLERFFAISVLKGADPMANPPAASQLVELATRCRQGPAVPLLTAANLPSLNAALSSAGGGASLRDVVRPA